MAKLPNALRWPVAEYLLLAALPIVLHFRSADAGLFLDDFAIVARVQAWFAGALNATWWDLYFLGGYDERLRFSGLLPWWSAEGVRLHFFRPLSAATHVLDAQLWPGSSRAMHLHSAAWLSAAVLASRAAYGTLLVDRWRASAAAALFAVSYVHAWPVGWIASRNALVAFVFGALALRAWARARERGAVPLLGVSLFVASLLSAEVGVSTLAYFVAYEVRRGRSPGAGAGRWFGLAAAAIVLVGWRLLYSHFGYGAVGSGAYVDPLHAPVAFLSYAPERFWALVGFLLSPVHGVPGLDARGGALLVVLGAVSLPLVARVRRDSAWLVGVGLCLVPLLTSVAQPRLLGFAVFGLAPVVVATIHDEWQSGRLLGRAGAVALAVAHFFVSPVLAASTVAETELGGNLPLGTPGRALGKLDGTNLVLLNPPSLAVAQTVGAARAVAGLDQPSFTWVLAVGAEVELERRGCCTVIARDGSGLFRERWSALYRGGYVPFVPGDQVKTLAFEARVVSTEDGRATEVEFTFGGPLRSKQYVLARWSGEDFVRIRPKQLSRRQRK